MPDESRPRRTRTAAPPAPRLVPWWREILRHPLTLLLAGTLLSSLIIPWINGRSARVERRQNGRQTKAVEILRAAGQDTRRLNALRASFENYERDTGTASVADRRAELRQRVYELYGEFDGDAWWWYRAALREADVFDWLTVPEQQQMRELADAYEANLLKATRSILDGPWQRYLGKQAGAADGTPVMPALNRQLGELQAQRDVVTERMVRVFR